MAVLTLSELTDLCNDIKATKPNYNSQIFSFFSDLYNLGVRPAELFDISLWSERSPTQLQLQPLKGNNNRFFDKSICSSELLEAVFENRPLYVFTSLRKQRYFNQKFNTVGQIFNGGKDVELYLFRYRYVKQLSADGLSDLGIQAVMGWTNGSIVSMYKNAVLEYL